MNTKEEVLAILRLNSDTDFSKRTLAELLGRSVQCVSRAVEELNSIGKVEWRMVRSVNGQPVMRWRLKQRG